MGRTLYILSGLNLRSHASLLDLALDLMDSWRQRGMFELFECSCTFIISSASIVIADRLAVFGHARRCVQNGMLLLTMII